MLSVELTAANALVSLALVILCSGFVYRLGVDVWKEASLGNTGFLLVFISVLLLGLWDGIAYMGIALAGGRIPGYVLSLTTLKPVIHTIEVISFFLLYLDFRKRD